MFILGIGNGFTGGAPTNEGEGMKKKFSKSRAKKKLHALWSLAVRTRDDWTCQWCLYEGKIKKSKNNHAHHIVSRSICGNNGAFEVENSCTLCYFHHIIHLKQDPDAYIAFRDSWLKKQGLDYHDLREKYRPIVKFTEDFYQTKLDSLGYVLYGKITPAPRGGNKEDEE